MDHDIDAAQSTVRQIRVKLVFKLARALVARRQAKHGPIAEAKDWKAYGDWRYRELRKQLEDHFGFEVARGKDALDFGCGDGALSTILMDAGAKSVHGVDMNAGGLARFAERLEQYAGPRYPTYTLSTSPDRIDLPAQSFDAIFCFDVMEHIMSYREIIFEWHRVLRSGGRVYIWWQPYWHPYGHHAQDWVPMPWAHAILNDREMSEVAARIVDWEEFEAPVWDRNPDGSKKNRFRVPGAGANFLNGLTIGAFEKICGEAGFRFAMRNFRTFSVPQPLRAIGALMTRLPIARNCFTSIATYALQRH
jgi:SAM-dependent methyltransferase